MSPESDEFHSFRINSVPCRAGVLLWTSPSLCGQGSRPQDFFKLIGRFDIGNLSPEQGETEVQASHREHFHTRCNLKKSGAPVPSVPNPDGVIEVHKSTSGPSPNQRLYMFKGSSTLQDVSRSQEACKKGLFLCLNHVADSPHRLEQLQRELSRTSYSNRNLCGSRRKNSRIASSANVQKSP